VLSDLLFPESLFSYPNSATAMCLAGQRMIFAEGIVHALLCLFYA